MTSPSWTAAAAVVIALGSASMALAQPEAQPDEVNTARPASELLAVADIFGAIDSAFGSTPVTTTPLGGGPSLVTGGRQTFWGANSSLSYSKGWQSVALRSTAGASVRRLTAVSDSLQPGYTGAVSLTGQAGRRGNWDIGQTLAYGPVNATGFFAPGQSGGLSGQALPIVDYSLADRNQLALASSASYSLAVSRRGMLSASAGFQRSGGINETAAIGQDPSEPGPLAPAILGTSRRVQVRGQYAHTVTRYLNLYGGYGTSANLFGTASAARIHGVDAGVAYNRPLSFSRHTEVSFRFGSSILQGQAAGSRRQWRAQGVAGLRHEVGRSWIAQLTYVRDARFVPTFIDPVLNDGVTGSLEGSLSARSSVRVLSNYSTGTVGLANGVNGYTMVSASASYRYAFLRTMAVYTEYFLFDFDFESGVPLSGSVFSGSRRHGVRFGLSFGTGLFGNRRRTPISFTGKG